MNNFSYKNLYPFKWFVLQNFPFIEADFDSITNWQLFCKLGEEMNKIIEKVNQAGEQTENLTNAFIELQNYVNNYFENLDVQEEINNKLDEMVESGEFDELLSEYLNGEINFYWPTIANQELDNTEVGNSCYIKIKDKVIVIDTMMREDNFNRVAQSMIANGITKIDYFVISHLDYDHYSNLSLFITTFDCSNCLFLLPRIPNNPTIHNDYQSAYDFIKNTLDSNNITSYRFSENETIQIENVEMKLFNAGVEDLNYYDTLGVQYNNYSTCTQFNYKDKKVLFVGDLLEEGQKHVAEMNYIDSNYDLMQDCHHSFTSYNELFMNRVHPKNVIAPASKGFWSQIYKYAPTLDFYSSYNANIYVLGFQEEDVQFRLNSYGLNLKSKSINLTGLKVNMGWKSFYVDSETTDSLHAGTQEHPFKTLKEAVSLISKQVPNKANINIININETDTIDIRYANDWVIIGNNNILPNLNIVDSTIEFRNCKFANENDDLAMNLQNCNIILLDTESTSISNKFIESKYSNIYIANSLTLSNKITPFRIFNNSKLTIDSNLILSNITTFINVLTSIINIRPVPLTYLKTNLLPNKIILPNDYKQCVINENLKDLYVLWSGAQSNFSQIILNDNVNNYEYLEIYYRGKYIGNNYVKVPKSDFGSVALKGIHISGGQDSFISSNTIANISENNISVDRAVNYTISNNNLISNFNNTNEIIITKIVGIP